MHKAGPQAEKLDTWWKSSGNGVRIDALETSFNDMTRRLDGMQATLQELGENERLATRNIQTLAATVNNVLPRLTEIERRVLAQVGTSAQECHAPPLGRSYFSSSKSDKLERIEKLEEKMQGTETELARIVGDVSANRTKLEKAFTFLRGQESDIVDLSQRINDNMRVCVHKITTNDRSIHAKLDEKNIYLTRKTHALEYALEKGTERVNQQDIRLELVENQLKTIVSKAFGAWNKPKEPLYIMPPEPKASEPDGRPLYTVPEHSSGSDSDD